MMMPFYRTGIRMRRIAPGLATLTLTVMAAAGAVLAPAQAADMAVPPRAPAYYPPAIYNWSGFYFGGNVGADILADTNSAVSPTSEIVPASNINLDGYGLIGGAQAGFNYQFGGWVAGVEGTYSGTNLSVSSLVAASNPDGSINGPGGVYSERATTAPHWIATAVGRLGYAADTYLFYVKGGGAWMKVDYTQDSLGPVVIGFSTVNGLVTNQTISDTRSGYTVGVGIEYGMTEELSARVEYDFLDFGSKTYNFVETPASINSNIHILTVGLNYRFNCCGPSRFPGQ
jgi:outer membrane immunogenic protein